MPSFNWLTFGAAKTQLAQRLAIDTSFSNTFWTNAECGVYIKFALRSWNALTEMFNQEFAFTQNDSATWYDLATMNGSPRKRTVTDAELYEFMQYMLLEPPTGAGTWTGTSQFTLSMLQNALEKRRNELIQFAGCNLAEMNLVANAGSRRVYMPDSTLEPRRARYISADSTVTPNILNLEDTAAMQYFEDDYPNQPTGVPDLWSVVTGPPLAFDTDVPPLPGHFNIIYLNSGNTFAPPAETLVNLPDDWSWLAVWGAMADLLSMESESTDYVRAAYFFQRYQEGMKAMAKTNWLIQGFVNNQGVDTPSLAEQDCYDATWQDDPDTWPAIVCAGMDFVAPTPVLTQQGISLKLVANAPIPTGDGDYVQVSRDVWDVVLGYAHFLATAKMGGQEFLAQMPLEQQFYTGAMTQNRRLAQQGLYWQEFRAQGLRQDNAQPRQ